LAWIDPSQGFAAVVEERLFEGHRSQAKITARIIRVDLAGFLVSLAGIVEQFRLCQAVILALQGGAVKQISNLLAVFIRPVRQVGSSEKFIGGIQFCTCCKSCKPATIQIRRSPRIKLAVDLALFARQGANSTGDPRLLGPAISLAYQ
jgi:hypothetical protein